ncbi:MAG: translation elongation factor Ts [Acidimicrobiaceae bacterium]|nr:translation elongation factor Ts [Acidimicrobiaceae bacterium]
MTITAQDVKALRDATGAGMMDAKNALTKANGDVEAAHQLLREQGLAKALTRNDRASNQGAVAVVGDSSSAALVMLKCETDFSAKNKEFVSLTESLARSVHADGPAATIKHTSDIQDIQLTLKENIALGEVQYIVGAEGNTVDFYVHKQHGRGINAVIVEGSGVDGEALHQVALHIAFAMPKHLCIEDVSPEEVERERHALLEITRAEGKPEHAWNKIVEGRLQGWYKERVLLEQDLLGSKATVKSSIGNGLIVRFAQVVVGV